MKILFNYKCDVCALEQEHFRERTDTTLPTCESCGSTTHKTLVAPAFTFKEGHGKGTDGGHLMRIPDRKRKTNGL